jgi:hypothetical protein
VDKYQVKTEFKPQVSYTTTHTLQYFYNLSMGINCHTNVSLRGAMETDCSRGIAPNLHDMLESGASANFIKES